MGLLDKFKKKDEFLEIKNEKLIEWNEPNGEGCMASDKITKQGYKVGFMYREEPMEGYPDSGWRFMAGDESDRYMNNPHHTHVFALNTLCNYDRDIIPYLKSEIGSVYIRINESEFEADDGTKAVFIAKQDR